MAVNRPPPLSGKNSQSSKDDRIGKFNPDGSCSVEFKRSCVHFVTPAGQLISLETDNLFYRNGEVERLRPLAKA